MPGLSSEYSACLEPAAGGRRAVLLSGLALYLAGAFACLSLPASGRIVALLLGVWCIHGLCSLRARLLEDRRVAAVILDSGGGLEIINSEGIRVPIHRLPGTIVLARAIWLCYRDRDGRTGVQLFVGDPRSDTEFRRASVLLRLQASSQKN